MNVLIIVFLTVFTGCLLLDSYVVFQTYKRVASKVEIIAKQEEIPEGFSVDSNVGTYNVNKFKQRMEDMRSEVVDGVLLYDSPPVVDKSNETGVEIITEMAEIEFEKRIKR